MSTTQISLDNSNIFMEFLFFLLVLKGGSIKKEQNMNISEETPSNDPRVHTKVQIISSQHIK